MHVVAPQSGIAYFLCNTAKLVALGLVDFFAGGTVAFMARLICCEIDTKGKALGTFSHLALDKIGWCDTQSYIPLILTLVISVPTKITTVEHHHTKAQHKQSKQINAA